ncbi:glycosyltransferase family 4 protein (plasmid) [Pedobacter sp. BS3]|uniref:glycosyltransferase family 4 protein n=1 Tax=Pedobacter sp. BS3 TaxID=2567937 RepID=UPI0011F0615C|nr:glycosyltransferase family 4 protein [Pedobacter sp. BS3]TZF86210.1 glycosyltransferase family 4 protein [Pedobacter sp. BS3]
MPQPKKIIIVAPHFPPSNLAAVHRSRLFAQHLPDFGWEPVIVTVHERYYEEQTDPYICDLLPSGLRIEKVKALPVKPVKLVGDIGIRAFIPLLQRILKIAKKEQIDFLYIPIPSNFAALLGPLVHRVTGIPYGIDYIDPWVHRWPGTERTLSKAWWSMKLGEWLEPLAVKKAALISGVAPGYYEAVLDRNPGLRNTAVCIAMPYGGEKRDNDIVAQLQLKPHLFEKEPGVKDFVYAGAMLPKAFRPLEEVMKVISTHRRQFEGVRIHFIGSGKSPDDTEGYNIRELAEQYGLWHSVFFEYPRRIPYLDVLCHLHAADGTFILGSTEAHYTPSKVYQSVLSGKAAFAILHQDSTACQVIEQSGAGTVLSFKGEPDISHIAETFLAKWAEYLRLLDGFDTATINQEAFEQYSARNVTRMLANALKKVFKH